MKLEKIKQKDHHEASQILTDYWKSRGMSYSTAWARKYLKKGHKAEIKEDVFFTLKERGRILGTVSAVVLEGAVAEIRDFAIKKEFQGKGNGTKAAAQIVAWCRRKKIRKAIALCLPARKKLFEKIGFVKEGILKDHFVKGEDLTIMSIFP